MRLQTRSPRDTIVIREDEIAFKDGSLTERTIHGIMGGRRLFVIQAGMRTGKSYAMLKYVKALLQRIGKPRVLAITTRIQQAYTLMADLKGYGFKHYKDTENTRLADVPLHIIQYESLFRLRQNLQPYDLIILDEARGICAQIMSPTNGANLITNHKTFKLALTHPKTKTLMLDANLFCDGLITDFINEFWPQPRTRSIQVYTCVRQTKTIITLDPKAWSTKLISRINNNEKCMCVFQGRQICTLHYPNSPSILFFDGESTEEHMKKFTDINRFVQECDVLLFTRR